MTNPLWMILVCWALVSSAVADDDDGRTIWGDDYPSTVKAMKKVMRAIGVKSCLHCHVKSGGNVDYEAQTPNKDVARAMKATFVDSLSARGRGEVELHEDDETVRILAVYRKEGEDAGIRVQVVVHPKDEDTAPATFQKRVALPKEGGMSCATCHGGKLHFVTEE